MPAQQKKARGRSRNGCGRPAAELVEGSAGAERLEDGGGAPSGDSFARAATAFARVAGALDRAGGLDELLRGIACSVRDLLGVRRCSVGLRSAETGLFHGRVGQAGEESIDEYVKRLLAGMPTDGMTAEMLQTRRPVVIDDARSDHRMMKSTVRYWSIRSMMAVPLLHGEEVIGVVWLDDIDRSRAFTAADADLAAAFASLAAPIVRRFESRRELLCTLDAADREIKTLRSAVAIDERLGELIAQGGSLQELLEAIAEVLGKPCSLHDAQGVQLAAAAPPGCSDGIFPRLLSPRLAQTPEVRKALAAHDGSHSFFVGPLLDVDLARRHLVAPVLLDGATWGRLVIVEHRRRFAGGDAVIARRAASLLALRAVTQRQVLDDVQTVGASLLLELLEGCADRDSLARRAERIGVRLQKPHFIACLLSRKGEAPQLRDFRETLRAFAAVAPNIVVHAASHRGGIVALVPMPDGLEGYSSTEWAKNTVQGALDRLCTDGSLVAGVSSLTRDAYVQAYREAHEVVECIRRLGSIGGPAVLCAADLGPARVFLSTCDPAAVRNFAEATFEELTCDPLRGDLLATLGCFFTNVGNIRRCALELGVHENTIRYRLGRIEELTGIPVVHDPDGQLSARLSMLVLMLQDRIPHLVEGKQEGKDGGPQMYEGRTSGPASAAGCALRVVREVA